LPCCDPEEVRLGVSLVNRRCASGRGSPRVRVGQDSKPF
jgi:hypothetical protein